MGPQHGTQRGMEQVSAAMVAGRVQPPGNVNAGGYLLAQGNVPGLYYAAMND